MKINLELLKELEKSIDTSNPENAKIPINILGYGEISLVFEILNDSENLAYKRIPIFDNEFQVKRHIWAYNEYNRLLEKIGLIIPESDAAWFIDRSGRIQFYCIQEKLDMNSICNAVIHKVSNEEIKLLVLLVLREYKKIWRFNKSSKNIKIGLDGQISNFGLIGFDSTNPKVEETSKLIYIDTSTPFIRINGKEAMEAVLFLKSAPSFLRGILKALFLEDTVGKYYNLRRVVIDLIANFFKEQRPELIPTLIRLTNEFFKEEVKEFDIEPLNFTEIQKYYKSDAQMWVLFQAVRRFDRFLQTKVFKKRYAFYLPGKIER